jgi:hypothetical protein
MTKHPIDEEGISLLSELANQSLNEQLAPEHHLTDNEVKLLLEWLYGFEYVHDGLPYLDSDRLAKKIQMLVVLARQMRGRLAFDLETATFENATAYEKTQKRLAACDELMNEIFQSNQQPVQGEKR